MKVTFKSFAKPEAPFLLVLSPKQNLGPCGVKTGWGVCVVCVYVHTQACTRMREQAEDA